MMTDDIEMVKMDPNRIKEKFGGDSIADLMSL